jgi:hypothetical protein
MIIWLSEVIPNVRHFLWPFVVVFIIIIIIIIIINSEIINF